MTRTTKKTANPEPLFTTDEVVSSLPTFTDEQVAKITEVVEAELVADPVPLKPYKVVSLDRSGLPSFPSSRESACKDMENYLETMYNQGYQLVTVIDRSIGVQPIKLLVFQAI